MTQEISYRCCLADDNPLFRLSLKKKLVDQDTFSVVGEAGNGFELLDFLRTRQTSLPDMAILDISMPKFGGIETASAIKKTYPDMKVLILTIHNENEYLRKALALGVDGYVLKEDADAELFSAISKIREGGVYISMNFDHSTGGLK